jgi:predicted DCC family thiol-disulfide oxidoreductase YuxK
MSLRAHLARSYLNVDPRSLGLFRILFGVVLLLDLYWRYLGVDFWYTNDGLLPNHTMLWAPPTRRMFSFFFMASTPAEARAAMALCALVFCGLIVGYRTRLMQLLTWLCLISLNTRICLLENGGDIVLNQLATWTLFLPLGQRFSADAVLASLRAREEHSAREFEDRAALRPEAAPVYSLAVLGVILQIFVIYLFNVLHKSGPTWTQGTAVHLALHQDRLVTSFGVWLREHLSPSLLVLSTYATLVAEALGAALVISPFWPAQTRLLALLLMPALHLSFALCMDLGPFSYAMAVCFPLLLDARYWDACERFLRARGPHLSCIFDSDCGVCFLIVRMLARLDLFERVRFVPNHEHENLPKGVTPELVEQTVVVLDRRTGRISTRADAIAEICRALPLGLVPWAVLALPGLNALWGRAYDVVARNRTSISQWLGLAACGVPAPIAETLAPQQQNGPARLRARLGRWLNEALVAVVLVAGVGETLSYNAAVPNFLHYPQPDALQAIIDYGRLIQSWRMFAPDAPEEDFMISVEANTIDGRLVDPYNEVASRYTRPPFTHIPPRLHNDQFFTTYSLLIPDDHQRPYWTAFQQWILSYHQRTQRERDRIVRFTVYLLSDRSPKLGQQTPTAFRKQALMSYP